jgi:hypothetical protein
MENEKLKSIKRVIENWKNDSYSGYSKFQSGEWCFNNDAERDMYHTLCCIDNIIKKEGN